MIGNVLLPAIQKEFFLKIICTGDNLYDNRQGLENGLEFVGVQLIEKSTAGHKTLA